MEESWQMKCSSTMQSSAPVLASSSSSLELRNQMEKTTSYSSFPYELRDLRSNSLGTMQGPMFPNYPNLSSQKSNDVNIGNSFLALLSGPPSLLQCDFKEFPNSKFISDSNGVVVNAITFNGLPPVYPSEQNLQSGSVSRTLVSTRGVSDSHCSSNSVLPGFPVHEPEMVSIHHMVPGSEKAKNSFSLNAESHNTVPSIAVKVSSAKVQVSAVEENSSNSPSSLSNCPRVFCMGTGGYLLISSTGLLGIVCTCHYLHMSVLKFCEHSGMIGGNAGDLVQMEDGETIALWRKLYFQNFGIRIPEDQRDWDWPEGVTASSGLLKSRMSLPGIACNFSHLVGPSEGLLRSGQIPNNETSSSRHTNQNMVTNASKHKQKRNAQDGNTVPVNSYIGISQGKIDTQIMEHPSSGFSTVSKSMVSGRKDGYQSTASSTDNIFKNVSSSFSWPGDAMQDLRNTGLKSDFSISKGAPNSVFVLGDAGFSNVELKLGQPCQSSHNFKTSDQPALGTHLLDSFINPSKLIIPEQLVTSAADCHQSKVEHGQSFYCAYGPCGASNKREQGQVNLGNHRFDISNVNNAPKLEKSRGDLTQNMVVSLLSNFNLLSKNSGQVKTNNDIFSCSEKTIPHLHHYESRMAKYGSSYFPRNSVNSSESQLTITEMGSHSLSEKGKDVKFATDGSYFKKDLKSKIYMEQCSSYFPWNSGNNSESQLTISEMGLHGLSNKGKDVKFATDGSYFNKDLKSKIYMETETSTSYHFVTAAQGRGCELYKLPGAPLEPPESRTVSYYPVNVPASSGPSVADHVNLRSSTPSFESGLILPSKAVTQGFPLASSALLDQTPAFHREEGKFLSSQPPDDNLRILALSQILELSKQQHTFSSFGRNMWEGRCDGPREQPGPTSKFSNDEDTNGCCDLSKLIRGIPIHTKKIDVQGQLSSDLQNDHLSTSRIQKNVSGPSEHEKGCGVPSLCLQQHCNCSAHKNCTEMNLDTNSESLFNGLNRRWTINGEESARLGSRLLQNHFVSNDKSHSVAQEAKSNVQLSRNIVTHTSQWRDVPTKVKEISKVMCTDKDTYDKCTNSSLHITHSHKEHGNSNISSESSAPAVTQLSVEVSIMDSSNADVENTGFVNNLVVDEGSGIDRCCSSDDALECERSVDFLGDSCNTSPKDYGSSLNAHHRSSRSLIDELKLINSLTWKKDHKQTQTEMTLQNKNNPRRSTGAFFSQHECRSSILSSMKKPIRKRDVYKLYDDKEEENICMKDSKAGGGSYEIPQLSSGKKCKKDCSSAFGQSLSEEKSHGSAIIMKKSKSGGCKSSFNLQRNEFSCKPRPIVCGDYGELSNGEFVGDMEKPAKIVSLSRVLKSARGCALPNNGISVLTSMRKLKNTNTHRLDECHKGFHFSKDKKESRSHRVAIQGKTDAETSLEKTTNKFAANNNKFCEEFPVFKVDRQRRRKKVYREEDNIGRGQLKSKVKEIRKRSIYELTIDGNGLKQKMSSLSEISKCLPEKNEGDVLYNGDDEKSGFCNVDEISPQEGTCSSLLDSDSFCSVCCSSNRDEMNYLLECERCLIRVHQACYGVSKSPKGHWYCRPCRTSSRNIVCVLCGYGGGAMTRALRSRTITKSLLRVWNIEAQCKVKNMDLLIKTSGHSLSGLDCSGPGSEGGASIPLFQREDTRQIASAVCKMSNPDVFQNSYGATKFKVDNSITAGFLDSTTKQWVHMVCGLWTPGTRCPNVDTMSAFDVSCAPRPRADVVCSICCRPGGSCIKCRVINCSVPFHPWCAHQKGLLQSEVEGDDNENVGFYGRCLLHATRPMCESDSYPVDKLPDVLAVEETTCARTEGYKGRKCDGFWHNYYNQSKEKVGCHVPQEQLNAWFYINGQKACIPGIPKLPTSDIENDCRKEYARYKQGRGWKHLVVYKSGIHALGLYTSRFISRGEMVVEYVGEIVGQRVSDKRENEYQSGRKFQYKNACYFFRIDKEHIIDATRKGGIARFVNHSCLPNCVAKVIAIRNEKKVIFFAERDIFPGEEITYDYHFNHEDEGKKILCFCSSKNCRRYLN